MVVPGIPETLHTSLRNRIEWSVNGNETHFRIGKCFRKLIKTRLIKGNLAG